MSIKKLYRVILRSRVNWTGLPLGSVDGTSSADIKPTEIEGNSIEHDITAYVADYKRSATLDALSNEATIDFNNPDGILTPDNTKSALNWTVLNSINTFAPLFVKGAEIQIYRITDPAYLNPSYRTDPTKWKPRFRGEIKSVKFGTQAGQDALQVTLGDALYRANKATLTGTYSPIMRSSSQCPANSFYTLGTLTSAVADLRNAAAPAMVMDPQGHVTTTTSFVETGEIPDYSLARVLYWDRDDYFLQLGKAVTQFYMYGSTFTDETACAGATSGQWVPANASTATAVWTLNGCSWFVESGTVIKDTSTGNIFEDLNGSLKLNNAALRHTVRKVPGNLPSRVTFGCKLGDGTSTITVKLVKRQFNRATLSYVDGGTAVFSQVISGMTVFNPALLGGTILNSPSDVAYTWSRVNIDPLPLVDPKTWDNDVELGIITLYELRFEVSGIAWIDLPRWEFISMDKNADNTAYVRDNNIMNYPVRERWITTDGITYTDPHPSHRSLSKKNMSVVMRTLMYPYCSGTDLGFGPAALTNRSLPATALYEKELVEGQDFTILYDKGAIELSYDYPQCEIFVRHTEYDLTASSHMEAANMIQNLLIVGMGFSPTKIFMETTGIILSKITLDSTTSTSIYKAIQDIRAQLPQNYYIYADGDGNIIGKFIQQSGSPRILNPIKQAPVPQISGGVLVGGQEYWYTVTSLMADGKETMPSNLLATVDYFNYFDATHISSVMGGFCPALPIKPVPNQVGFVIRRAQAYKTAASTIANALPTAKASWGFDGVNWKNSTVGSYTFAGTLLASIQTTTISVSSSSGRRGGAVSTPGNLKVATAPALKNANGTYSITQVDPDLDAVGQGGAVGKLTIQAYDQPATSAITPTTDTLAKTMTTKVDLRDSGAETGKVAIRFELQLPNTALHLGDAPGGFEIFHLGTVNMPGTISIKYVPMSGSSNIPHNLVVSVYGDSPSRSVVVEPKIAGVMMEVYVEYDGMTLTACAGGSVAQKIYSTVIAPPTYGSTGTELSFGTDCLGMTFDTLELFSTTIATSLLASPTQFPYFTWDQANSGVIATIPTDPAVASTVLTNRSWFTFIDRGFTAGHKPAVIDLTTADTIQSATLYVNEQAVPLAGWGGGTLAQFITWITTTNSGLITFPWDGKNEVIKVSLSSGNILQFDHYRGGTLGQMSFVVRMTGVNGSSAAVSGTNWNRNFAILGKIPQQYCLPHTGQINEGISVLGSTITLTNLKGIQLELKDDSLQTVGKVVGSVKNRPGSNAALVSISPINFYGSAKAPFPKKSLIYGYPETLSSDLPMTQYYQYAVVFERFLMATASATVGAQPMRTAPNNRSRQGDHFAGFSLDVPPGTTLRGVSINFVNAPVGLLGNAAAPVLGMTYDWGFGTMQFPQTLTGSGDYDLLFYPLIAVDDDGSVWQPIPSLGVDAVKVSGANLWHTISFTQTDYDTLMHVPSNTRLLDGSRRIHMKFVLAAELSSITYQGLSYRVDGQPKK